MEPYMTAALCMMFPYVKGHVLSWYHEGKSLTWGGIGAWHVFLEFHSAKNNYPLSFPSFEEAYFSKQVVGWPLMVS